MNKDTIRQWTNLISLIAAFVVNTITNIKPIDGISIKQIADSYDENVLVIPANYAFAIWGLIYLGLLGLGIYQALPANKNEPRCRQLGYLLTISSLAQIAWVILFQYRLFFLSLIAMFSILIPLIILYIRLDIYLKPISRVQKWLINFPISIYLAWISVATILNVAIALASIQWNAWNISITTWTILMLIVTTVIGILAITKRRDIAFAGVLVWAFVAIAFRHLDVLVLAGTAVGLALLLVIFAFKQKSRIKNHFAV
ncbi:hypothetical protein C7H19_14990 [Aphanothece hegewaldii CCALA 016]|uniref:Tryptophan-rich sensory protein n=1 Tax=Aphanothece hegewaldii CCALA 016 TaxID=2107694 RepID=A0A2T1LWA9_9CHRO|nr:tryptophan-rich sensory protein [Aphanothece hegewaldii]PSF36045.1 hypothetical protein C7H19_14990 [Aphanothece hegewaldii CCALA 016]